MPRSYTKYGSDDWVEKYERVECDDGTWKRLDKTKVRTTAPHARKCGFQTKYKMERLPLNQSS